MARLQTTDHMHNFRFHVTADVDGVDVLASLDDDGGQAGFQSVGTPEMTLDVAEYREGTYQHTRKYPGVATWSDVTFTRGVTKADTTFYDWVNGAATNEEYRADLAVYHWHRDGKNPGQVGDLGRARIYQLFEAVPMRVKFSGDLDSTDSEISLAEIDVAYEFAEITNAS